MIGSAASMRMDEYVGRRARLKTGFETGRSSFASGEVVLVTGHHRGRLEILASDGRVARKVRRDDVDLLASTSASEGSA